MNVATPERRRLQFKLWTIFALVTIVSVFAAWVSVKVRQGNRIEKVVAECGATVSPFDPPSEDWGPRGNAVAFSSPRNTTDKELRCLKVVPKVQHLWLSETNITDQGMREIGELTELRALLLIRTGITDQGLRELGELRELRALHLGRTKVTDLGLKYLSNLEKLELLGLNDTGVTDEGLDVIAQYKALKHLDIANTKVTDIGADKLQQKLPKLRIERRSLDEPLLTP